MLNNQIVTIFGGSGFVGRHIVRRLATEGYTLRIASRTPASCYELRTAGAVGQIVPQFYDPGRPDTIAAAIIGSVAVINCVGMLYEHGRSKFHAAHAELPRQIATTCKRLGVRQLVHISSLGVDVARSNYARTKLLGEKAVRDNFPGVTILRPSVMFGADDRFFNRFARLAQIMPALPLVGGGRTRLQPVYVDDVAEAVLNVLRRPPTGDADDPRGKIYELGGPEVLDFRAIYDRMFAATGQRCMLAPLPWGLAKFKAMFLQLLPDPLLTVDQVRSLQTDNVVQPGALGLDDLGVTPTPLDAVLPSYLARFRPGGTFAEKKRA